VIKSWPTLSTVLLGVRGDDQVADWYIMHWARLYAARQICLFKRAKLSCNSRGIRWTMEGAGTDAAIVDSETTSTADCSLWRLLCFCPSIRWNKSGMNTDNVKVFLLWFIYIYIYIYIIYLVLYVGYIESPSRYVIVCDLLICITPRRGLQCYTLSCNSVFLSCFRYCYNVTYSLSYS